MKYIAYHLRRPASYTLTLSMIPYFYFWFIKIYSSSNTRVWLIGSKNTINDGKFMGAYPYKVRGLSYTGGGVICILHRWGMGPQWTSLNRSPVMTTRCRQQWVGMSGGGYVRGVAPTMRPIQWCIWCYLALPLWTDRRLWNHYLPTTTVEGRIKARLTNHIYNNLISHVIFCNYFNYFQKVRTLSMQSWWLFFTLYQFSYGLGKIISPFFENKTTLDLYIY